MIAVIGYATPHAPVGDVWTFLFEARDSDGWLTDLDPAPTVTVTLPNGTTAPSTPTALTTGIWRADVTLSAAGRWSAAVAATGHGVDYATAYAETVTAGNAMPDLDDVLDYLNSSGGVSYDDADVQDALDAEAAAQRSVCRVTAVYPDDLRQALLRRVQANLARRALALGVPRGDAESPIFVARLDNEVRRFENPHRKVTVG